MLSRVATLATVATTALAATNDPSSTSAASTITLKPLNIEKGSVTVSGLSSGGFMAAQMHVAYSSLFDGVGVFAGGPYYCALGSLTIATDQCMYDLMGGPQTAKLIEYTNDQAAKGTIDATSNMANDKVYVFSGSKDTTVYPGVVKTLEDYYAAYVNSTLNTKYNLAAQHCIPTLNYGETCSIKMSPYIGDCSYEGAGTALQTFYGSSLKKGSAVSSNLYKFDQTEFFSGSSTSIASFGYVYIPTACADGSTACRLHLSFHGCLQDYSNIQDTWAVHAGYNDWAEANNIIVVYPYTEPNKSLGNPNACWDWWGYTGSNYVLKSGVQMTFAKKILDRLMGN
jgi:poly(3-hydroxybutyrate) depolymerase